MISCDLRKDRLEIITTLQNNIFFKYFYFIFNESKTDTAAKKLPYLYDHLYVFVNAC